MSKKKIIAMLTAAFITMSTVPAFAKPAGIYLKSKDKPNEVMYISYIDYMKASVSRNNKILKDYEVTGISVKNDENKSVIDYKEYAKEYRNNKTKNMDDYSKKKTHKKYKNPKKVKKLEKNGKITGEIESPDKEVDTEQGEFITISEARNKKKGDIVTVKGIVTLRVGNNAFLQDENSGIYIYCGSEENNNLKQGNRVKVKGSIDEYNGVKQIKAISNEMPLEVEVEKENETIPAPIEVRIDKIDESMQGKLVIVKDVKVRSIGKADKAGSYSVIVTDKIKDIDIRVDGRLNPKVEADNFKIGSTINVTGAVGKYNESNQLVIGKLSDIELMDEGNGEAPASPLKKISEIQGKSHKSPLINQSVATEGVITVVSNDGYQKGFFMQSLEPDNDPATSEGIFVKYKNNNNLKAGDKVKVEGTVKELINGMRDDKNGLTETTIDAIKVEVESHDNKLPEPVMINIADELAKNKEKNKTSTDIAKQAIDYYESLEGMLVKIEKPLIVGADERYGEIYVVPNEGKGCEDRLTKRGGMKILEDNPNPEVITIDDVIYPISGKNKKYIDKDMKIKTGDKFDSDSIEGVMSYGFGKFKFLNTKKLPKILSGETERQETTIKQEENKLTVVSYNIENFNAKDNQKVQDIADNIVTNLKCPDIIGLIEVECDDGQNTATGLGVDTEATKNYEALVKAINDKSKVEYCFTDIAPIAGEDGGRPGGNIRQGFIYRKDRVSLVNKTKGNATTSVKVDGNGLSVNPGRIDPNNKVFNRSRKPLIGEFEFKGEKVFVIANHLNSKRGDESLFGQHQPPVMGSQPQRHEQVKVINNFVKDIEKAIPNANIVTLGDMNDYEYSETLKILKGNEMKNMIEKLPLNERYTYVYSGSCQVLDNVLVSNNLYDNTEVEVVHINAEFTEGYGRVSDHDPVIIQMDLGIKEFSDKDAVTLEKGKLELGDLSKVSNNLEFPTKLSNDVSVTWESEDTNLISNEGKVSFPKERKEVKLIATLTKGEFSDKKEFTAKLATQEEVLEIALDKLDLGDITSIKRDIKLPTLLENNVKVSWKSNDENTISNDGKVTRPEIGQTNKEVKLTATLTLGETNKTREFNATVLAKEKELQEIFKVNTQEDIPDTWVKKDLSDQNSYVKMICPTSKLITEEMNFNNYSKKVLSLKARTFGGKGKSNEITVSISVDGGQNWEKVTTIIPKDKNLTLQDEVDLSKYSGEKVKVKLETLSADGNKGAGITEFRILGA